MSTEPLRPAGTKGRPGRPGWPSGRTRRPAEKQADRPLPALALNIADVGHEANLAANDPTEFRERVAYLCNDTCRRFERPHIDRIYVGSYFCDRFFVSLNRAFYEGIMRFCREYDLGLTLVVPLFGQATLATGKKRLETLVSLRDERGYLIDEAVANDPATALFLRELSDRRSPSEPLRLSYGRMMAKTPRDPRYSVMEESAQPHALDAANATALVERFGYEMAECDPTAPHVDATALESVLPLALHLPHCLLSTGHICHAASTNKPFEQKFRAGAPCRQECLSGVQVYEHYSQDNNRPLWFTRLGRTVLFENPGCELEGQEPARIVWTPADFICASPERVESQADSWGFWSDMEGGASWE